MPKEDGTLISPLVETIRKDSAESLNSSRSDGSLLRVHVGASTLDPGHENTARLSVFAITVNFTMLILGTTVLGIASQMKHGGWLLTPALLCLSGLIVMECIRLVCATIEKLNAEKGIQVRTYHDLAFGALGVWGARVANLTSTLDLVFYTFISLVLESQILQAFLPIAWPWFGCVHCGEKWWAVLLSSATIVFCFVDLGPLAQCASTVGPVVCLLMVGSINIGSVGNLAHLSDFPELCREGIDTDQTYWDFWPNPSRNLPMAAATILSYSFFCFAIVCTVPTLQSEMREPSKLGMAGIMSITISSVVLISQMCLAYGGTGNFGPENIIDGMRCEKPLGWWALSRPWEIGSITWIGQFISLIVTTNLVVSDATYVPCAVIALERVCPQLFEPDSRGARMASVVGRLCLVLLRLVIAVEVKSFIALSSLSSSLFCLSNNVLLPIAAFYGAGGAENASLGRKIIHVLFFLIGCFILVFGTISALSRMVSPSAAVAVQPGLFPRAGETQGCRAAYHNAINDR